MAKSPRAGVSTQPPAGSPRPSIQPTTPSTRPSTLTGPTPTNLSAGRTLNTNDPAWKAFFATLNGKNWMVKNAAIQNYLKANNLTIAPSMHVDMTTGTLQKGGGGFDWTRAALTLGGPLVAGMLSGGFSAADQAGGLLGFEGDGAVIGGMPTALPETATPVLEGLSAGPGAASLPVAQGAASIPGSGINYGLLGPSAESASDLGGVGSGLLGPSAETADDLAFANGTGGVQNSLLGPTAPHAADSLAGSNIPSWLKPAAQIGGPLAAAAFTRAGNSNNNTPGATPLDPATQGILNNILQMSQQRMQETQPVHEAAMRLAMSMAPNGAYSPRMQQSITETNQAPSQGPQMSPNVAEAYRRLMQGNG